MSNVVTQVRLRPVQQVDLVRLVTFLYDAEAASEWLWVGYRMEQAQRIVAYKVSTRNCRVAASELSLDTCLLCNRRDGEDVLKEKADSREVSLTCRGVGPTWPQVSSR